MARKKATMKEMQKVVSSLLQRVYNLEFIIDNYHEWKNEKEEFKQYVLDVVEKSSKNRTVDNVSDK